jgi:predicted nuclease of predicted toxin-antitoxin system
VKIKLDENLPFRLVGVLAELGHETDTVAQEGMAGYDDDRVWNAARNAGRFLITQDLDFSDVRRFMPGTHPGILLVRLREPGRDALLNRLRVVFKMERVEEWAGCFVVITEHKIRVRRPAKPEDLQERLKGSAE